MKRLEIQRYPEGGSQTAVCCYIKELYGYSNLGWYEGMRFSPGGVEKVELGM